MATNDQLLSILVRKWLSKLRNSEKFENAHYFSDKHSAYGSK